MKREQKTMCILWAIFAPVVWYFTGGIPLLVGTGVFILTLIFSIFADEPQDTETT